MSDWKTTIPGLIAAGAAFVLFAESFGVTLPPIVKALAAFVMAGGLASLGINAKQVGRG